MKRFTSAVALLAAACCIAPCLTGCGDKEATKTVPTGDIPSGGNAGMANGAAGEGKKNSGATAPTTATPAPAGVQTGNMQGGQKGG
jgi:hypothetical protein